MRRKLFNPRHSMYEVAKQINEEPVPREDDVERCDFGAAEIAELKAENKRLNAERDRMAYAFGHACSGLAWNGGARDDETMGEAAIRIGNELMAIATERWDKNGTATETI